MAYQTLSENIVAALITFAGGDLSVSLGEAVDRLEAWQREHDCQFGVSRDDVGSSLALLHVLDPEFGRLCDFDKIFVELTLSDVLPVLLEYKHWCSNDEGDYWEAASIRYVGEEKIPIRSTSFRTYRLKQFLESNSAENANNLMQCLRKLGLDERHLRNCAYPGCSS